jgi:hypothetical protein
MAASAVPLAETPVAAETPAPVEEEKRDAPDGWGGTFDEPAPIAASSPIQVAPVPVVAQETMQPAAADSLLAEAARLETQLAADMAIEPRTSDRATDKSIAAIEVVEQPPEKAAPAVDKSQTAEGVVLPFPTAQEPQRLARVTLRKMPRVPVPHAPNDTLQPVAGETATAAVPEPEVDDAPPVVLSADLSSERPAHPDAEDEFDDPSATPLPSPMPPPFDGHPVLTAGGAPLEVRAPSTPATVEEDDYEPEPSRRGLIITVGAIAVAAAAGLVLMVGNKKPVQADPPPVTKIEAPKVEAPTAETAKVETPTLPSGATTAPSGVAVAPSGATTAPSGVAVAPSGEPQMPVVEVKPGSDDAEYKQLLAEGKALYDKGQVKKAIVSLEKAIALKADGDEALVILANCHLDRGNMEKALAAAQLAAAANAENADAYLVIGAVQQQKEHNPEARIAYEKYLKLAPKGQYAGEIRSILVSLH